MNSLANPIGIAQIVARNITPLAGILFFDWSASNVLILYFIDTLLSIAVIFAGLARSFSPSTEGVTQQIGSQITFIFVAIFLTAFFAIPLGMPVGMALATADFSWRFALYDESLRLGVLAQCIIALGSYVELYRALGTHTPEQLRLKQRFGLVVTRWVVVIGVCYTGLGFLGEFGVFLLVAAYIGASIFAEIAPDRFLRGTTGDAAVDAKSPGGLAPSAKAGKQRH